MRRKSAIIAAAILVFGSGRALHAYEIDYATDRPEALRACDASYFRGDRTEARRCYSNLLATDSDLIVRAEASWALDNVENANEFFKQAFDSYPEDPRVRLRWGRLFEATYNENGEHIRLYQEALALDEAYVPALLAYAELAAGRFEGQARQWVDDILEIDDEAVGAHLLHARMELEVGNLDIAEASLSKALEIIERRDLPPLEVYALRASIDLLNNDFESQWIDRALEYNPRYGDAYAIPAYFFVITRRYREAIEYYQRAVEIQPDLYSAHTELGINLLRENRIEEALRHIETAHFGANQFSSAETVNTGKLIDKLYEVFTVDSFDANTVPAGSGAGVILRLHRDEQEILTPYVLDLVNESIESFSERYAFSLQEPVIAELYPLAADFSVRTAGLTGIGLLGVTFGYLVAMNSPSQAMNGEFHWGTTLWHEIAHVFTLEATDHLVPRWFSEGVSVYEEWSTGPLPGRHIPIHVLQAFSEDKMLPIADLDEGFIRPSYQNQVIVSYMQAGLICEFIAAEFGQAALRTMLDVFREGGDTSEAIATATSIAPAEFDERFNAAVRSRYSQVFANLEDWNEAQTTLQQQAAAGDWAAVMETARDTVALIPQYVDEGSAYLYLARAEREAGETDAARETLLEYWRLGGYSPEALMQLARWLVDADQTDTAIEVLEAVLLVAPLSEAVHAELGDLLLETRPEDAIREFTVLAALDPLDQASVNLRMARAHRALGDIDRATEYLLYALEIAPNYREAQQLLLEIVR